MRFTALAITSVLVLLPAAASAASDCSPRFRVGRIEPYDHQGCTYRYLIDAICTAGGKCPPQDGRETSCRPTGRLTYHWTVVQTGGSGSVVADHPDFAVLSVQVVPPVTYTVSVEVGGCATCCVDPITRECTGAPVVAPPASSSRTERIRSCN